MNTKHLHLLYGIALLILIPVAAFLYLTNRGLVHDNQEQSARIEDVEDKITTLETKKRVQEQLEKALEVVEQREATPTAEAVEDTEGANPESPAQYSIQVLNAKGVAGVAGEVQKLLEDSGYTVDDIDNTTWQPTSTIEILPGNEELAEMIKVELANLYTFSVEVLDESSAGTRYDAIIKIGSN